MNISELIHEFILSLVGLGILLGSLGAVLLANVAYSAFCLGLVFTRISLSYFVSNADSVAAVQLLVYVGAINVLIVFAVMVTNKPTQSGSAFWGIGFLTVSVACVSLFLVLVNMIHNTNWFDISLINQSQIPLSNTHTVDIHQLGYKLFSEFLLPFELLSILLLVALVGAVNSARDEETSTTDEKSAFLSSRSNNNS
uniref:NADH dehydrogenase subunit 6 n=1 Tax=Asplenium incisum TaxID=78463 RepID=UPI0023AA2F04|nr:NADH dehydrogenase subunit 6 [Asplenium incisum]WCL38366.1 NADH dehydrogenase subunit 6 [Asplenium incisum]